MKGRGDGWYGQTTSARRRGMKRQKAQGTKRGKRGKIGESKTLGQ